MIYCVEAQRKTSALPESNIKCQNYVGFGKLKAFQSRQLGYCFEIGHACMLSRKNDFQVKTFVSNGNEKFPSHIPVQSPTTFRWIPKVALVGVGHWKRKRMKSRLRKRTKTIIRCIMSKVINGILVQEWGDAYFGNYPLLICPPKFQPKSWGALCSRKKSMIGRREATRNCWKLHSSLAQVQLP